MIKIALQLYSLRDDITADFKGTLKKVKEFGYDGVELAGLQGYSPEEVREMCREIGLIPISAHVTIDELSNDVVESIRRYKAIGCEYVAIPWMDKSRLPGGANYDKTKKVINAAAVECEKQGVILLYHNHDFEFDKLDGEYLLDILFSDIPAIQTEIDTCWVNVGGEDPVAYLKKYSKRAPLVHFKDFVSAKHQRETGSGFEFMPLGLGQQNIEAIVTAAKEAGTKWAVIEQDNPSKNKTPCECARLSIEYLKKLC